MKMTDFARVFQPIPSRLNYQLISTIRHLQRLFIHNKITPARLAYLCLQVPEAHFCQNTTYQTRVVHSEVALWLTRMSELSRFAYVGSHVTLHVKSNA